MRLIHFITPYIFILTIQNEQINNQLNGITSIDAYLCIAKEMIDAKRSDI